MLEELGITQVDLVFGTTPELWLNLQMAVDLWAAQQNATDLSKLKTIKRNAA